VIDPDAGLSLAAQAFGCDAATWGRLTPRSLARLASTPTGPPNAEALASLAFIHEAQARPDLSHVHPSWIERTLKEVPEAVRLLAQDGFVEPPSAVPDVIAAARTLAAERLVGGEPIGPDDPPVVAAIGGLSRGELIRLLSAIALAKRAYVPDAVANPSWTERQSLRFESLRAAWGPVTQRDPDLVAVAARDLDRQRGELTDVLPRLGLVTFGRLLTAVDPFRARWALQHLPYKVVRAVRAMGTDTVASMPLDAVRAWESRVLDIASRGLAS
jgi:hypothetical protein